MSLSRVNVPTCDCRWAFRQSPYGIVGGEKIMVPVNKDGNCVYCRYHAYTVRLTQEQYEEVKKGKKIKRITEEKNQDESETNPLSLEEIMAIFERTQGSEEKRQRHLPNVWKDEDGS